MQKALILALLTGAFLFPRYVTSQENPEDFLDYSCPDGGSYQDHPELGHICSAPAPSGNTWTATTGAKSFTETTHDAAYYALANSYLGAGGGCYGVGTIQTYLRNEDINLPLNPSGTYTTGIPLRRTCVIHSTGTEDPMGDLNINGVSVIKNPPAPYCAPDNTPTLINFGGTDPNFFCWAAAVLQNDCPEENGDCEPEPNPDDCPPDTIGGCVPPEPDCFIAGNGMEVCFEDPNDKCDLETVNDEPVYSNCQAGCGFVNDNFLCGTEPDLPSLDDCLVTTNGYACAPDVPEPDDDITDPNKPMPDMVKGDFKDTMRGVESRIDANNELLADQIKRDANNTSEITKRLDKSNQLLTGIDANTKDISESLKGDGVEFDDNDRANITSMLGITGDESIVDLTVSEISLDTFKDDFQWSGGSTACPAPRAINMLGRTWYMEWEPYCEAFSVLSYFIMAAATLFSAFIAFGVKK
ncbi:virulence factor TspB C-terminal domain-related protein [Arsukibacterium indicum]|uniref:Uncharacterized protein n=1 Tax=Arsukibacterium indicum TaxID=2848612 RepID=A0ABS6MNK1_9GAMM|nr:virulence factor TspB C-terminal domain-related protein [Arsukibacterium indicum]MBV2129872.1 hypothetical protein [Arsukibacterium indicum]